MTTILRPCKVPWMISPSMAGVTLQHMETDVQPECTVVFGGGRLQDTGLIDQRRIELTFNLCWFARVAPKSDLEGLESEGFEFIDKIPAVQNYRTWLKHEWLQRGYCPHSGFYVALESAWIPNGPEYYRSGKHYVICGRDGYVELLARGYSWREWIWSNSQREEAPNKGPVVGHGDSSNDNWESLT